MSSEEIDARGHFRPSRRHLGALLLPFLAAFITLTSACGVPIAALELTPTVEPEAVSVTLAPVTSGRSNESQQSTTATSSLGQSVSGALAVTPAATATAVSAVTSTARTATPAATGTGTPVATTATPASATTGTPGPAAVTGTGTPTQTPAPAIVTTSSTLPGDAIKYLNDYRVSHGLSALRVSPTLTASAQAYASLMAAKQWFNCGCDPHTGPDGTTPDARMRASGYGGSRWGEALAAGQASGVDVVNSWFKSASHAAIVLNPAAVDVGVGYAYNPADPFKHYWALVTGSP